MSHPEQTIFITDCLAIIKKEFKNPQILEVGSYNVNSIISYRNFIKNSNYIGIDLVEGPGVDIVLSGDSILQLNTKFDIIISAECFEHAQNWHIIFDQMIKSIKDEGYIILTIASKGRAEHGTARTEKMDSPGSYNYYMNLTKKDFFNKFNIKKIFEDIFFFYNINTYDLYVILRKKKNSNSVELIKEKYSKLYKDIPNLKNIIKFMICSIIGDKNCQNLIFTVKKFKNLFN